MSKKIKKVAVISSDCNHPISYATYAKFCPRKCLVCGKKIN